MNVIEISDEIQKKIKEIDKIRSKIKERGDNKVQAISSYEKKIAVLMIGLKNGKEFELENEKIINPPVTIIKDIVKGICWEEKLEMETAEMFYKSCIVNLDATMAQLNALQSINRHLDKA